MVSTAALIAALQGQFAAARQGQGPGSNAGLPGLLASGNGEGGNAINALASGGLAGGGVPTTATTGQSIASGIGGVGGEALADPVAQQVFRSLGREPGEQPERPNAMGGDVASLLSVLGGPTALLSVLGSLVASNELGLPPTTSVNSLIQSDRPSDIGSLGIRREDRETGFGGPVSTGLSPPSSQNIGSLGIRREDRDRSGPPSRSTSSRGSFSPNSGR